MSDGISFMEIGKDPGHHLDPVKRRGAVLPSSNSCTATDA